VTEYFHDHLARDDATPAASRPATHDEAADQLSEALPRKLHPSAPPRAPLTGSRAELEVANRQLHDASVALARTRLPVSRLRDLLQECATVEVDLENKRQRHLMEIGSWLARDGSPASRPASPASRPAEPPELLLSEQRLARLTRDVAAARLALPDCEQIQSAAARAVGEATAHRDAAHRQAILQAVAEHVEQHLVPALRHAQQMERLAWQMHDLLAQRDDHVGAAEIRTRMHRTLTAQYAASASAADGRAFSDRLLVDPSAELGSTE
jgi:hypothetical protein